MEVAEIVCLMWGTLNVGLLVLFVWGEIKAERYWNKMDRRLYGLD